MDYNNYFFYFSSRGYLTTFSALAKGFFEDKYMEQKLPFGHYDGYSFPIVFNQHKDSGKMMRDFLDTRCPPFYLVSERTVKLMEDNGITGWKTYPIELYDKKGNYISGYQGFSVIGRAGMMEGLEEHRKDRNAHYRFHLDRWDGSDFFSFENTLHILATQRVKDLFKKNKVDAVEFGTLEEWDIDLIDE